ncbi:hypothetical protein [Methylocystis rosea]|uniref:hypothetical protein n=1 Tax=Methylocystis rosea TaxID=173366 RepID=UPI00039E5C6E|nr:hypothetical protein [Methylocystis rosea]
MRIREMSAAVVALAGLFLPLEPAMARDRFEFGNPRAHSGAHGIKNHRHNGVWIDNDRGHWGADRGRRWGHSHDHFSPRGHGGHHWGW